MRRRAAFALALAAATVLTGAGISTTANAAPARADCGTVGVYPGQALPSPSVGGVCIVKGGWYAAEGEAAARHCGNPLRDNNWKPVPFNGRVDYVLPALHVLALKYRSTYSRIGAEPGQERSAGTRSAARESTITKPEISPDRPGWDRGRHAHTSAPSSRSWAKLSAAGAVRPMLLSVT